MLAGLSLLAVVFFLAVAGLSRAYYAQQESLGKRWFARGIADLSAGHDNDAVKEFRTALRYSRDNYAFQLNLADALIGLKREGEAKAYLTNLWDRQPENEQVNLDLARIAVKEGRTEEALRYYHNVICANWQSDREVERRDARLELINFLLKINATTQAQSELMALAASGGHDSSEQARVGDLFYQARDYEHALAAYEASLKLDPRNMAATKGLGLAAFELGRYDLAQRYLQAAVSADPRDTLSRTRLRTTESILRMDPFQPQLSADQRDRIVINDFAVAGDRLKSCASSRDSGWPENSQALSESWEKMKPDMTLRQVRRHTDLTETAMEMVFQIERESSAVCANPTDADAALLLIAKLHERN